VIVRDWLNANHVLIAGRDECALIDTGYGAHAERTLALLRAPDALGTRALDRIVNTHCHSDHMGGNAAIARAYGCSISLPLDAAPLIEHWDTRELLLDYADQQAEPFACADTIAAGDILELGDVKWQALAAPGHDMTALAFYATEHRVLVSGDALWERGLGLIEPVDRLEERLAAARATLERIARLDITMVIPGHGAPFSDVDAALEYALKRLDAFAADSLKLARHCLKSLFVFALLARGAIARKQLGEYFAAVPCYREYDAQFFGLGSTALGNMLTAELLRSGAIVERDGILFPAGAT
jgi:glyoxylase-like metal-dependent hydrolase (beta-lactamase superfamily II)